MTNQIIIRDNKTARLLTDDQVLRDDIHKLLSFRLTGVEYTAAYQNYGWDGKTYLLTKKNEFPSGLVSTVRNSIEFAGQTVEVIDERQPIIDVAPIDISDRLARLKRVPRDYQIDILNATLANRKGIIRAATGAGKTLALAMITAALNKPTIVYVIGLDLLQQIHDLFSSIFEEEIGFIGNGVCNIQRINIASIWSVGKALDLKNIVLDADEVAKEDFDVSSKLAILKALKQTKIHLFDECHMITCDTVKSIFKYIDPERVFGCSGTPWRDDGGDLLITGMLGEKIIDIPASLLIERGVLVQPTIKFIAVPAAKGGMKSYQEIYKSYIVENDDRNGLIIDGTKALIAKGYAPLVLFKQIKHGKILAEQMNEHGVKYAMLYGNDSLERRTEVKEQFAKKEIDAILASTIFDIGLDLPEISGLVLGGGGKSSIRALQRIGRAIRSAPNKTKVAVIDFYDQTKFLKKHSKLRHDIYCSEPGFKVISSMEMK